VANAVVGEGEYIPPVPWTDEQVAAIYAAYPRKADPEAAHRAIRAALKRLAEQKTPDPVAYLLARTKAFAASTDGQKPLPGERDWRKYPATWFNAGSYENEIEGGDATPMNIDDILMQTEPTR
jgi:hypothetical protein